MSKTYELNAEQLEELRRCATIMVEADNLEQLSWDDAWAGIYPQEPTDEQIEAELSALKTKAERILGGSYDFEREHDTFRDIIRLKHLEDCKTIDIWMNEPVMDEESFDE
ncbi:hypothetical protein [Methylophaga sp.]|uniref:hypothetical protein n=1 Tax=Methylophaga sp. TaxID=2024840 RepID=UPI0013FEB8C5|nr:hypothetical protein [Methylophaga sp.]MTI63317.1 hypothetical protein [Methylophaga sp.]